jgi:peptide/nickel transport system ATP-binding protein
MTGALVESSAAAPSAAAGAPAPRHAGEPLLVVRDLATHFFTRAGVVKAVDGVSFEVGRGEIVGLVGESGSGKSMTGHSILGLVDAPGRVVRGSIRLDGRELVTLPPPAMRQLRGRQLAMVFQDPMSSLNPVLTIGQQIRLAIEAHERVSRAAARARAAEALSRVGIADAAARLDAYPHEFSGGMRQRVAIAIALLNRPQLIIADEPTTALDVSIQAQILAEIKTLVAELGTALIWISHDLTTVSALSQRVLVMYAARIVEQGPTAAVLRAPRHPYTRGLVDSLPSEATRGRELAQIPGLPPSLLNLPAGCAFRPRCARASAACLVAPEVAPGLARALAGAPNAAGASGALLDSGAAAARQWRCHHPLGVEA